jgi:MPBQ/MSBQ methyltransferase
MSSRDSVWDEDYRRRGRLWGGVPAPVPDFPEGAAVLEVGCGDGKTLSALARMPYDVTAVDIAPGALRLARRLPGNRAVADARCLPFRPETFDAVLLVHVLGHLLLSGRRKAASEAARVLKPGGGLFFRGFSVEDMRFGSGKAKEDNTFSRGGGILTHYFTEDEVEDLFSCLVPVSIGTHRWRLRVRGADLPRAEIVALFSKSG